MKGIHRREFLTGSSAALTLGYSDLSYAQWSSDKNCVQVGAAGSGITRCSASISKSLNKIKAKQEKDQWCWAACISMSFAHYGHPVKQERIVEETYLKIVNWPSGGGENIMKNINRPWIDDNGKKFVATGEYVHPGEAARTFLTVANALAKDMPVIMGALGHATIMSSIEWEDRVGNLRATSVLRKARIIDPWTGVERDFTNNEQFGTTFIAKVGIEGRQTGGNRQ